MLRFEHNEAIRCYDKAIAIDPSNILGWYFKCTALFLLKRIEEAKQCYDKVLELKSSVKDKHTLSMLDKLGILLKLDWDDDKFVENLFGTLGVPLEMGRKTKSKSKDITKKTYTSSDRPMHLGKSGRNQKGFPARR